MCYSCLLKKIISSEKFLLLLSWNQNQLNDLNDEIQKFCDILNDEPGRANSGNNMIETLTTEQKRGATYSIPYALKTKVKEEFHSMLRTGIIEP